jgi:hypothetical protein
MTMPATTTMAAMIATDTAWPIAIGISDCSTTTLLRLCRPSATAKSQPIAGFTP